MSGLERVLLGGLIGTGILVVVPRVAHHLLSLFPAGWGN